MVIITAYPTMANGFCRRVLFPQFYKAKIFKFPYDVKLRLLAHSRSFLANQKARNAILGAENLLNAVSRGKKLPSMRQANVPTNFNPIWPRQKICSCKGGEIRDTKTLNLSRNIVSLQVFVDVSRFSPSVINLTRNKTICCGLKKVVAESRARVYFEQQSLVLLLVFHQTHNLSRNKFTRARANQLISALHIFNPQQMFLLRVKFISPGEKRETSTKTCNETMLHDKLRVFVSRISPP